MTCGAAWHWYYVFHSNWNPVSSRWKWAQYHLVLYRFLDSPGKCTDRMWVLPNESIWLDGRCCNEPKMCLCRDAGSSCDVRCAIRPGHFLQMCMQHIVLCALGIVPLQIEWFLAFGCEITHTLTHLHMHTHTDTSWRKAERERVAKCRTLAECKIADSFVNACLAVGRR